jgi:hypothetical protein
MNLPRPCTSEASAGDDEVGPAGILKRLSRSTFRARFRLGDKEQVVLARQGMSKTQEQAADILLRRVAPAHPAHDGKQTPMRGHPVFIAQHATATCCRGCIAKWHGIPTGKHLSDEDLRALVAVIGAWLACQPIAAAVDDQQVQLQISFDAVQGSDPA